MRRTSLAFVLLFSLTAAALLATTGAGNSRGAPDGSANTGCTCHGPASSGVKVTLSGLNDTFEPGLRYGLTLRIDGASDALPPPVGLNQGGFAIEVSSGSLAPVDATSQLIGKTLTHTGAGNDQRSWPFAWIAPPSNTTRQGDKVEFKFAGNGVNGDGASAQFDQWNKATRTVTAHVLQPPTASPLSPSRGAPAVGILAVGAAVAVAVLLRLR